jgi:c-di-GMP-binding flagellar brake protein YcgR
MGVSALSRKDVCIAQGLVPGVSIHLEAVVNGNTLQQTTRIEDINDVSLCVLIAMEHLRARPLALGANVAVQYTHQGQPWTFTSEVIGHSSDGMYDLLALPEDATSGDRRRYFRLPMVLPAEHIYHVLPATAHLDEEVGSDFDATVVDLAEGGAKLSSRSRVSVGDVMNLEMSLPDFGPIEARMRAVRVQAPSRRRLNYRVACTFTSIDVRDKQRIAGYLMSRQIEMRRKGQL